MKYIILLPLLLRFLGMSDISGTIGEDFTSKIDGSSVVTRDFTCKQNVHY